MASNAGKDPTKVVHSEAQRVVVITGGARGIGRAIAQSCQKSGFEVVIAARSKKDLDESAKLFPCTTVQADVSKAGDLVQLMKAASGKGPIYGLVCAAGVYGPMGTFKDSNFEEWQKAIDINLTGTARSIHAALPYMKPNSRIVLFSGGGQGGMSNFSAYTTSKGGIWRLTETLGAELAKDEIYLNAMAPGAVNTKLLDDLLAAGPKKVGEEIYQKSLEQKKNGGQGADKAAALTLFLLSEQAKGLYGKTISAVWDPILNFKIQDLMKDEIYTFRRVVDHGGNTRTK